jgi:hypothetical protein
MLHVLLNGWTSHGASQRDRGLGRNRTENLGKAPIAGVVSVRTCLRGQPKHHRPVGFRVEGAEQDPAGGRLFPAPKPVEAVLRQVLGLPLLGAAWKRAPGRGDRSGPRDCAAGQGRPAASHADRPSRKGRGHVSTVWSRSRLYEPLRASWGLTSQGPGCGGLG